MGRCDGRVWLTSISHDGEDEDLRLSPTPLTRPQGARVLDGSITEDDYRRIVAEAADSMRRRGVSKVVLARDCVVESLARTLGQVSRDLHVDNEPHLLPLANVIHLASDAHGTIDANLTILDVAGLVHPTAALGRTPTPEAQRLLSELEGADRDRFAGPVGWLDGCGNGQLGIALRCGQLEARNRIRLWAGAGILPSSSPESELAETRAKMDPMLSALGVSR